MIGVRMTLPNSDTDLLDCRHVAQERGAGTGDSSKAETVGPQGRLRIGTAIDIVEDHLVGPPPSAVT